MDDRTPQADGRALSFRVESTSGEARVAKLATKSGIVETPAFMPVGTRGAVKGVLPSQLRELGAQILLANTYHLEIRPGSRVVERLGGLHEFTGWDGPILTDSGGFQVFSLADLRAIDDHGVEFKSHIDGDTLFLTATKVVEIQSRLGTDIAMVLDHCPSSKDAVDEIRSAVDRTLLWARESARARELDGVRGPDRLALFAIQQGGASEETRAECTARLLDIDRAETPFDGFAIGGVSVGEDRDQLLATIPWGAAGLPAERPRYLMGVSGFQEYVHAIDCGIDLFDCVLPTRNARNGTLFNSAGEVLRVRNQRFESDVEVIEPGCDCFTCQSGFSRGFLHHLCRRSELNFYTLASIHNLRVFHRFLEEARAAIRADAWADYARRWW